MLIPSSLRNPNGNRAERLRLCAVSQHLLHRDSRLAGTRVPCFHQCRCMDPKSQDPPTVHPCGSRVQFGLEKGFGQIWYS
jgi:hypothetical protein